MPATRMLLPHQGRSESSGTTSSGEKKRPVPEDAVPSQVPAGVFLERHRDVDPVLVSCSMPSTNATFPASAMSSMSPPARSQSMTRLPFRISTPSTSRLRSSGPLLFLEEVHPYSSAS